MIATSLAAITLQTTPPFALFAPFPIKPKCLSIPMSCRRSLRFLMSSRTKYEQWLSTGGSHASSRCKERVGRFLCMETFPPCDTADRYAVFPCRETCQSMYSVCYKNTPVECPLDGPSIDATTPGNGTHYNSNNELQSCFFLNRTVHEYPCVRHASPFTPPRSVFAPPFPVTAARRSIPNAHTSLFSFVLTPSAFATLEVPGSIVHHAAATSIAPIRRFALSFLITDSVSTRPRSSIRHFAT